MSGCRRESREVPSLYSSSASIRLLLFLTQIPQRSTAHTGTAKPKVVVIGVATNVCVTNAVFQAVDRFFRVCLVPEACGAFDRAWHDQAVSMLNGPQIKSGHSQVVDNTGLYFCETATVDDIVATLEELVRAQEEQ